MNIQQMIQAMNKAQKLYQKKREALIAKEFKYVANGAVEVTLNGDYDLISINFVDEDILKEDKDMVQDMIKLAFDGAKKLVDEELEKLEQELQGAAKGGLPF